MIRYKHTTKIGPERTAAEMDILLARAGATHIQHVIEGGQIVGMDFLLVVAGQSVPFRVPIRVQPIFAQLEREYNERPQGRRRLGTEEVKRHIEVMRTDAAKTAWRIALEWLKVQLAFVDSGARSPVEVFLADMILPGAQGTVGQMVTENGIKALLPAPKDSRHV